MRWIVRRAVKTGALLTLAALIALFASSGAARLIAEIYALALGAVVMLAIVRVARTLERRRSESPFARALAAMRAPELRTGELAAERDVELSRASAFHYHVRVRPILRDVAGHRLQRRYGVDLDREAARARELVPSEAWEIVRPDRPMPADRLARGPSLEEQRTVLDELERL
jgi:hypothetical protein